MAPGLRQERSYRHSLSSPTTTEFQGNAIVVGPMLHEITALRYVLSVPAMIRMDATLPFLKRFCMQGLVSLPEQEPLYQVVERFAAR